MGLFKKILDSIFKREEQKSEYKTYTPLSESIFQNVDIEKVKSEINYNKDYSYDDCKNILISRLNKYKEDAINEYHIQQNHYNDRLFSLDYFSKLNSLDGAIDEIKGRFVLPP
ncbi:MAG: hypothetical protein HQK91_04900 [Nitrospirae bacterium]|nr:hypothetical protein [Nitrospirota bacterium]MBF0540772.1 hypothetical protein [Nitrospirota bacterium]